ncbi:MAG TPA: MmgE/PrpD family protein [Candidatus Dormibacteraeota bacterium]|nr:MmgE/PrpD family protein [Candidatus Dormibacteraeota bacterium]
MSKGATRIVAEYAAGLRFEQLPAATVEHAKQAILDVLGIAVRARFDAESSAPIARAVEALGAAGPCTVIGHGAGFAAQYAALLNAAYAHTLDFDDTHVGSSSHPGAPIVPAALAMAEERGVSGKALIAGVVAGYDVMIHVAETANPKVHYDRGFHPTATAGTFGATAAIANALACSADALENAFGINVSQAAGSLQFLENGSWMKRLHVGLASHNAVLAHRFSEAGVLGSAKALEGRAGFYHAYSDGVDPEALLARLGARHQIEETAFKPYPSCRFTHAALDELIALVRELELQPEELESLRIALPRKGMDLVGYPEPYKRDARSVVDGQFSMYFTAAAAILTRGFGWSEYALLGDPRIARVVERINVTEDPEVEALYPRMAAKVELRARGRIHRRLSDTPKGEPEKPLTWGEIVAKFDDLAGVAYGPPRRKRIVELVRDLDRAGDVRALTEQLGA